MPALGGASRRSRKCDVVSCCFPILMQRGYGRVGQCSLSDYYHSLFLSSFLSVQLVTVSFQRESFQKKTPSFFFSES